MFIGVASFASDPIENCKSQKKFEAPWFNLNDYMGWRIDFALAHYLNVRLTPALEAFLNEPARVLPCTDSASEEQSQ